MKNEADSDRRSKRVLWISPRWPVAPKDGASLATNLLLSRLANAQMEVDLLALLPKGGNVDLDRARRELGIRQVFVIERETRSLKSLLRSIKDPITYAPFNSPEVLSKWQDIADQRSWDGVVYDGLHAAALFCKDGLFSPPGIFRFSAYRSHNCEFQLWRREAARAGRLKSWPLRWQGGQVQRFERSVLSAVDINYGISLEDVEEYRELEPKARTEFLPVGFDFKSDHFKGEQERTRTELNLLYVGRLDWPPNRNGLEWFLRSVWPSARKLRSDITLSIVGNGSGEWLKPYLGLPGIEFHGRVEELAPYYERANACITPVFYGSGVRVKALEAGYYGKPCLSSAVGVGGTGLVAGEHYIPAETASEWIDSIRDLNPEKLARLGDSAHRFTRENYDADRITDRLRSDLLSLP